MSVEWVALGRLIEPARTVRAGDGVFPILSMTMHDGLVEQTKKFKKRVASADTSQYKVVRHGQLVVGFPIDEGVLSFQDLHDEAIVSPAYGVWRVRPEHDVEPKYLERFLRSRRALAFYSSRLRGTTARRRSLPSDVFLSLPVPLPSLAEQRRTADVLERAEALRAKRQDALTDLAKLAKAMFLDRFGDPTRNEMNWPRRRISEFSDVITGNTPSRANPDYFGNDIEWIKSGNINTPHYYLTPADECLSRAGRTVARTAPAGSILVTCIAGSPSAIGNAAMADREVAFNQQINAVVPREGDPHFLYVQLLVGKQLVQGASTGGMKGLVSKSRFGALALLWPPAEQQRDFGQKVLAIESLRATARTSLSGMDELIGALERDAFSKCGTTASSLDAGGHE